MPTFHEIRQMFGGDNEGPWYVIHSKNLIHAVCLRLDLNPNARENPAEVWVGAQEDVAAWGKRLAFDAGAVQLFVSPGYGQHYDARGSYYVADSTDDAKKLKEAMRTPGIGKLSRIVYLTPVSSSPTNAS